MEGNTGNAISITDQQTVDVLAIRKLEVLLDVLAALEGSNAPELSRFYRFV